MNIFSIKASSIPPLADLYRSLGYAIESKQRDRLRNRLKLFRLKFEREGLEGSDLTKWDDEKHKSLLLEMGKLFFYECREEYWPKTESEDDKEQTINLIVQLFYRMNFLGQRNQKYRSGTQRKRAKENSDTEAEPSDTIHVASTRGDIFTPYSGMKALTKPTTKRGALSVRASSSAKRIRLPAAEETSQTYIPRAEWDGSGAPATGGLPQHPSARTHEHNNEAIGVLASTAASQHPIDSSPRIDSGNVNEHASLPGLEAGESAVWNQSSTLAAGPVGVFTGAPFANMDVDPEAARNIQPSVAEAQETPSPAHLPTLGGSTVGTEPARSVTGSDGALQPKPDSKEKVRFKYSVLVHYPKHLRKPWKPRGSFADKTLSRVAEDLKHELTDEIPLDHEAARVESWGFAVRGVNAYFRYEVGREGEDEFREMKQQMMRDVASSIQGPSDRTKSWEIDIEILSDKDPTARMSVGDIDFEW